MPHLFPEKMGLDKEDIVVLQSLPEAKSKQRAAIKPNWADKFEKQVATWNRMRENYICCYQKLVDFGIVDAGACDVEIHYESNEHLLFDMNLNVEGRLSCLIFYDYDFLKVNFD